MLEDSEGDSSIAVATATETISTKRRRKDGKSAGGGGSPNDSDYQEANPSSNNERLQTVNLAQKGREEKSYSLDSITKTRVAKRGRGRVKGKRYNTRHSLI